MDKQSKFRGCLLGLAAGDAMGYTVDTKTLDEICRDYGPAGLLGYDLVNGYADISSHTQLAAFVCNGLLAGLTRGQLQGHMAPFVRYISAAAKEWAHCQQTRKPPEKSCCWVAQLPELRRRNCMDTRMVETLLRDKLGTPEEPENSFSSPGALCAAIPIGLFFEPERMDPHEVGRLGAEAVALTHGDPTAFLTGAAIAYMIAGIIQDDSPLEQQFLQAAEVVESQFGREYPQAVQLHALIRQAVSLAADPEISHTDAITRLSCRSCPEILAGAVYASLSCGDDFDSAMITAVNHSGRSSAVGSVTGAILGAKLGEAALPEFYLECLEPAQVLRELADDLAQGCPMERASTLFDDDWDHKYVQGQPMPKVSWFQEEN